MNFSARQITMNKLNKPASIIKITVLSIFIVFMFSACVTTSSLENSAEQSPNLSNYKGILIQISSDVPAEREAQMLEAFIVARLSKANLFERVIASSRTKDGDEPLRLHVKIVSLRQVSSADRVSWGVFAGNARVLLGAELIDQAEQKSLSKFISKSSSFGGTFGATTSDTTIDRVADEIVDFIIQGKIQH